METNRDYNNEKRNARRKRRMMSQIFAYLFLLVVICIVGVGIFNLVKLIGKTVAKGNEVVVVSENEPSSQVSENEIGSIATPDSIMDEVDDIIDDTQALITPDEVSAEELEFINGLSTEQKAALLFITTPESVTGVNSAIQAGSGTRNALNTYMLGGLVYANRNVMDSAQYTSMLQTTNQMYNEIYSQDILIMATEADAISNLSPLADASATAAALIGSDTVNISFINKDGSGLDLDADIVILPDEDLASMETDIPCSMSSLLINDSIRSVGYNKVVVTGAMDLDAVTSSFDAGEAAVLAINNGADMVLRPADFATAYQAVVDAITDGTIEEERLNFALAHIYRLRTR